MINDIFGEGGWLSEHLDNYKTRPGQVELAEAIDLALEEGHHLLAEGPTGTGKSMAYGIPAALHAFTTEQPVVIVTANITLQEQLYHKDLPLIADILDGRLGVEDDEGPLPRLKFHLVKGMANYVCKDKIAELEAAGVMDDWFEAIAGWASFTQTGDKSELDVEYPRDIWGSVSCTPDDCTKSECKYIESCFAFKARGAGQGTAQVVVTNYHMLYTDIMVREATGNQVSMLPPYKVLIMDEAHEAVDIAMSFNGFELSPAVFKWMAKGLTKVAHPDADRHYRAIVRCADNFFSNLHGSWSYDILRKPLGYDDGLVFALRDAVNFIRAFCEDQPKNEDSRTVSRLKTMTKSMLKKADEVEGVTMNDRLPEGNVYYIDKNHKGYISLCCKVVEVQDYLRQHIFSHKTVIAVSATLATGSSFKFIANELGLHKEEYQGHVGESPFNPERVLLVVPDIPAPKQRDQHMASVARVVEHIAKDLKGRTMALFTSYKALEHVNKHVSQRLKGVKILVQGELPKSRIIEVFKKEKNCLILATSSFWQGVDIPGQSLSCLIIDKFPFLPPSDPVLKYLEEVIEADGGSAFFEYSIPKAVIALKQGVGRLIRTEEDFGVVVLCDNRIDTTGYGKQFLKAFPVGHFRSDTGSLADVSGFLNDMNS